MARKPRALAKPTRHRKVRPSRDEMLTRGRGPGPLRSRTGPTVLAGLFACALLGTAIVRKPAIPDLDFDVLGFVRNFMNYTSDEDTQVASKIAAVKATIQKITALPTTPAARGGVQTPCSGCWGDTSGVCQSEGNQVCYDLVQGDCPSGTKPCEASPLVPVPPPPPPMEQCTGCWGLTEGVCQGADDVCYPLLRGQCPSGTKPCEATSLLPNPSPPPPMEPCTGCFGETKGVCQSADAVCYPLVRGHACPRTRG